APHRAPAHAGVSYPADPAALAATLEGFLSAAAIGRPGGDGDPARRPRGLLAPHIDFLRGGPTYGRAYGAVGEIPAGTCAVVVGVAHAGPPAPYVLTTKGYATPGRVIEVDRPLLDAVASRYPFDAMTHEAVHRTEHSIEFQVLFLDHLAGGRPLTILPVLCSSFEPLCGRASPSQLGEVESFIAALRDAIAEAERPVIVVGGVDLSHVGPRFGDAEAVGPTLAAAARADDLAALDRAVAGDAEGFWQTVMADGNRRRVCGLSAIYTVLRLLTPTRGQLLAYNQGEDPAGGMVGFAAAVFGEVRDRNARPYALERTAETVAVFDAPRVHRFVAEPAIWGYLVRMLTSFIRTETVTVFTKEGERYRRRRFSTLNMEDMIALAGL